MPFHSAAAVAAARVAAAESAAKLALIIPTLHEAGNVPTLLERIRRALDPLEIEYEIIIVDDDSRDGIQSIVAGISLEDPRVRLVTRVNERGLAGAVLHGWRYTDASILGVIDADLQHPPELLPMLWAQMELGTDVVVASRYACGGSIGKWNTTRRLVSAAAVWATVPLQRPGIRAQDPMSGFFLLRRSCIENLKLQSGGYKLLLEILVRGKIGSLAEVPFEFGRRCSGQSKATLQVAGNYLKLLARLYTRRYFSSEAS